MLLTSIVTSGACTRANEQATIGLNGSCVGVLYSKFLNSFIPEAADERALNVPQPGKPLNGSARRENHRLCLNSLKALGRIPKIDPRNLAMGEVCHLVLYMLTSCGY